MPILFLQSLLPTLDLFFSKKEKLPLLIGKKEEPVFCLLPRNLSSKGQKSASQLLDKYPFIFWIAQEPFFKKKFLQTLQPLYFMRKRKDGSFFFYDVRYLHLKKGLYKLPSLKVDLTHTLLKISDLQEKENHLLFPSRTSQFYCKGDSTDRLNHKPYINSLLARRDLPRKKIRILDTIYLFLKKLIDV